MSDIVEFVLQLKSYLGSTLQKEGNTARNVFNGIDGWVKKTQTGLEGLGKEVRLKVDTSGLGAARGEIERTQSMLENLHNKNFSGFGGSAGGGYGVRQGGMGFGSTAGAMMVGQAALQGVEMAGRKVEELGKEALESGMNIENAIIGLTTLTKDPKEAKRQIDDIQRASALTPYTTQALLPGIRSLEAAQYSFDRAKRDVWAIANAVAAGGGNNFDLEMVMQEITRAGSKGVIEGGVIREMGKHGINIIPLLQNSLPQLKGLSREKAGEKLGDMTLSYDMVTDALYKASQAGGMFEHALEHMSRGIEGKQSTILDYVQMVGADLVLGEKKNIDLIQDALIDALKGLPDMIKSKQSLIDEVVNRWKEIWGPLQRIGSELYDYTKGILAFATSENSKNLIKSELEEFGQMLKLLKGPFEVLLELADKLKPVIELATFLPKKLMEGLQWIEDKLEGKINPNNAGNLSGNSLLAGNTLAGVGKNSVGIVDTGNNWGPMTHKNDDEVARMLSGKSGGSNSATAEASDAVVSGGRKQIIINVNEPFYKVDKNVFQNIKEHIDDLEPKVREAMIRILQSANYAL